MLPEYKISSLEFVTQLHILKIKKKIVIEFFIINIHYSTTSTDMVDIDKVQLFSVLNFLSWHAVLYFFSYTFCICYQNMAYQSAIASPGQSCLVTSCRN